MAALASAAEIPPGGEGVIKATVNTRGRSGTINKIVTVETSDPDSRMVRLKLKATILVEAGLEPRAISIGRIGRGEEVTKISTLVARDPSKVKLTGVEVIGEDPTISAKIIKHEGRDAVEVLYKASKVGAVRGRLKVSTTSEKHPTLDLPLHGFVLGNWEILPRTMSFPTPEEGDEAPLKRVLRVKTRAKTPYRVTKAVDPEGFVKTKLTKTDDGYEIELTLTKVPEKRRGSVEISTTDPDERTLEARYFIRRSRPGGPRGVSPRPIKALKRNFPPTPTKR